MAKAISLLIVATLVALATGSQLEENVGNGLLCDACRGAVGKAQDQYFEQGSILKVIDELITLACSAKIAEEVCQGAISEMSGPVMKSLGNKFLDPDYVCYHLNLCSSPAFVTENFTEWQSTILADKPDVPLPGYNSTETFNVAHISDLHIDFQYEAGMNIACGEPLCCRKNNGPGATNETQAGWWGSYQNCDIPVYTLEAALKDMAEKEFDFIVWTGDNPPHDIWMQSQEIQKEYIGYTADLMYSIFNTSVPIYPTLGNHGCFPVNVIDFSDAEWLTDWMAQKWAYWLPEEQQQQIREWGGAYSILNEKHNLRVISLNTNACNNQNFYFIANITDQGGQIVFLGQELAKAEEAGEKVYLIGHIAPCLKSCLGVWAEHYMTLFERYQNIISGQFFGHTHSDVTCVNREVTSAKANGVQFMPGSVTTYQNKNPSYRIYQVERDSKLVFDLQEYRLDLPYWNSHVGDKPFWDLAYTFKAEYGLSDMLPATMLSWVEKSLGTNETEAIKYLNNQATGGPSVTTSCDEGCRARLVCDVGLGTIDAKSVCNGSKPSLETKLLSALYGNWTYKVYN